jgi:prepilin-type N-terminal cleavage/methylation domain-containing protein
LLFCFFAKEQVVPVTRVAAVEGVVWTPTALVEHSSGSSVHRGVTLVELLVVIAVIGVLVSLMLPAVQASREAGRRTQCLNQIKQIIVAFHHHHDVYSYFPTGGWSWRDPPTYAGNGPEIGEKQKAGWGFQILPFVEADNVWRADALQAVGTTNPLFFCPTRRSAQIVSFEDKYDPPLTGTVVTHALCDYAASNREQTGVVRRIRPLAMASILDGTTNTLLLGEKRLNRAFLGMPQDDDNEGYTAGWNEDTIRGTSDPPLPDYHNGSGGDGEHRFGSSHPGTFDVGLADGSVRAIPYSIDPQVFAALGHRSDGRAISLE